MEGIAAKTFSAPDIVIFVLLILVSVGIGIFFAIRNKNKNTSVTYFLGDRSLNFLPVALSFVVTFQSSILILGFPAEAYAYGMQYSIQTIGIMIAYTLGAIIVVPIFHPLKVTSVYQYYSLRYGENSVRYLAATGGILYYILYMAVVLYGTAMALEQVTNIPPWLGIVTFATVAVMYTSVGGLQAVIWTDVFQCGVMLIGILAVLIKSTVEAGGSAKVIETSKSRFNFFYLNPDPTIRHTFWTLFLGSISQFFYLSISQAAFQRINATPTMKAAQTMMCISGPVFAFTWILAMFEGVTLFAYYTSKGCDPLASGQISNINQLIPYSMMELFHNLPGFPGCVIAALAAAALSTISSGLSSLAAVAYEDIIKQIKPSIRESTATNISRLAVVAFGIISGSLSFSLMHSKGPIGQVFASLVAAIDGPQVGLFLTSILFRRSRPKAVVLATLVGVSFVIWIGSGQNFMATTPTAPYLPLGPTEECMLDSKLSNKSGIISDILKPNYPYLNHTQSVYENYSVHSTTLGPSGQNKRTVLQTLYSISYMYFNLIGCITTVIFGVIFSLLSRSKQPIEVNEKLMFSCPKWLPWFCQKNHKDQTRNRTDEMQTMLNDIR